MTFSRFSVATCVVGVVIAVAACSGPSDRPELAPVEGTVTLDGKPLAGVQVVFGPEKGRSSFALTDAQGHYVLGYTFDVPGAVIGNHKVAISTPLEDESDPDALKFVDPIPARYNTQTTLTAVVNPGPNVIDFPLESK